MAERRNWRGETGLVRFHARFYDPAIVRTPTQDPHAESYLYLSPYAFFANNPLVNIDPTGMDVEYIYDDDGNKIGYKVTGDDVANYQSMLKHVSIGNSDMSNVYDALDAAASSNDGEGGAFASTGGEATAVGEMPDALPMTAFYGKKDFRGSGGFLKRLFTGGNIDGAHYDWGGNPTGPAPIAGDVPSTGMYKNPKFALQLHKQLIKDGTKSILKTYKKLQRRLLEHKNKLPDLKYKSSVEREIRTWEKDIETAKQFIKNHGIQ